ncbi:hypothetical protein [Carboxylicivirga sp. M1479]|uniref:hypothetical protein n=1 Tax=Carboxylicivirga sp. M1479 TaxID=2594476 RepID=UPI00117783F7|nr:hypothetical protein [Carboxylicivirga sp. M1479]TRX71571.1 hypothetical protein FNN09_06250 [Carboxylicivirga sp. M1479]
MKRIVMLMAAFALILSSCNEKVGSPEQKAVEISFTVDNVGFNTLKNNLADVPVCSDLPMDYAIFMIDGIATPFEVEIFSANGKFVTQPIKVSLYDEVDELNLSEDKLTITSFIVYNDDNKNGHDPADKIVRAAPLPGSLYYEFVSPDNDLNLEITIKDFEKVEAEIDVLCFDELRYENFGFTWFELNLVRVESQCWFGDICVTDFSLYEDSRYKYQQNGIQFDMPAIMRIDVFKKVGEDENGSVWNLIREFTNDWDPYPAEGNCLEVYWPNDEDVVEWFKFELYVMLPGDNGVEYTLIDEYIFTDGNCPDPGDDGVNDFVIGDCLVTVTDVEYPQDEVGCTYTQGYWRTHSALGPAPYDPTWASIGEGTLFFLSNQSYHTVINTPSNASKYYILARQYIAAKLNILKGADDSDIVSEFNSATILFQNYTPAQIAAMAPTDPTVVDLIAWAKVLDNYNNGFLSVPHCN